MERLILPDDALADGRLITPPHIAAAARLREELYAELTARLGRAPHAEDLAATAAERPHRFGNGPVYVCTLQRGAEACHLWWRWQGLNTSIEVLDVAYTPSLQLGQSSA